MERGTKGKKRGKGEGNEGHVAPPGPHPDRTMGSGSTWRAMAASLASAASASCGATCACLLLHPLDVAKTKRQAGHVDEPNTTRRWWKGAASKATHAACAQFVFFYAYAWAKSASKEGWSGKDAACAWTAAMATVCTTHQLDTWATRKQVQGQADEEGKDEERKENGWTAAMVLTVNPVVQYVAYEAMRRKVMAWKTKRRGKEAVLGTQAAFVVGAASKCIATITTYPLARAKVLQQVKKAHGNMFQVLVDVYRKEGMAGWYRGLKEQLYKTVLQAAVMMAIKERMDQMQHNLIQAWKMHRKTQRMLAD